MKTFDSLSTLINSKIAELKYPKGTPALFDPVRYMLDGGGKRIRPQLLLASFCAISGKEPEKAISQALGLEMFHNFTLLHDDVMDNADIRHGRPTVHRKWSEDVAILSGDAMLTMATELIADCDNVTHLKAVLALFNRTAMEVYQGQQMDMEFENTFQVGVDDYIEMIRLKTSVLLGCACRMGAMLAGASEDVCQKFYDYGINLGLAFQLRDDWLDTFGDPLLFGKEIGGDILNNKKTWLLINALAESDGEIEMIIHKDLQPKDKIEQVVAVYNRLQLGQRCSELVDSYVCKAVECVEDVDIDCEWFEFFKTLAQRSASRMH